MKVKDGPSIDNNSTNLNEQIRKEILNLKIQSESLYEKNRLNAEKIVGLDVEIKSTQKKLSAEFGLINDSKAIAKLIEDEVKVQ